MLLQPHNSPTLHSVVVELAAADAGDIPPTLSRALHALVLKWLALGNSEAASIVHASQNSPLSISGLLGNRRPSGTQIGDYFYFRIGILDGSLIEPLLRGFEQSETQTLILADFPFVLRNMYAIPGTHRLAGAADYGLLSHPPQVLTDIELHFLSPTSFKQNQGVQTFPLPELVFNSLHRRWNAFAPPQYQLAPMEWNALVSAYDLKTHALKLEGGAEIGTQGWVRYRFHEVEAAKMATILANFAFFSGVGRKTSMGMGQTQLAMTSALRQTSKPKKRNSENQHQSTI
ncbi:CRISPR system precrRNA processing endoribonuclease RAMP protein Cas6 [Scytonema sp. PRP1]|uniref:CRISPR system precrRNA processing endoribonuclease RAMP protein Cas6 n=1 Tax=Scytonema sp. PRP1 TaxID=3120513 RepID=UPI00300D5B8B